jgi:hypothetical protein
VLILCGACCPGEQHEDQYLPAQAAQGRLDEREDDWHGGGVSCQLHQRYIDATGTGVAAGCCCFLLLPKCMDGCDCVAFFR